MKQIILRTGMFVAGIALLAACNNDDGDVETGHAPSLQFITQMDAPQTRASANNTWDGGEQVMVNIDNAVAATPFTVAADKTTLTPNAPIYWTSTSQTLTARAWYPYAWTMQADQSTEAKLQAADFLFAPTVSISYANRNTTPLAFSHRTAKVTANLTVGDGITATGLANATVRFYGYRVGTPNSTDGTLSGISNGQITPLKSGSADTYTALLIPRDMTAANFIRVAIGSEDYYYKPAPGEASLEAGKSYTYNITVKKTGLEVTVNPPSNDWTLGTEVSVTATPAVTFEGLATGTVVTVNYKSGATPNTFTIGADGKGWLPLTTAGNEIIRCINIGASGPDILIGRKEGSFDLKFSGTNLVFRDAVDGVIPIGSYAEFQLINTTSGGISGSYKQEADLDLMNEPWTPIGTSGSNFTGTFDGGGYSIDHLYVSMIAYYAGLFGWLNDSEVKNVHIRSGSVSGGTNVGGVVGYNNNGGTITGCSNASLVTGNNFVGGVAGYNASSGAIVACYNTGKVSGTESVGGLVGSSLSGTFIVACYNTGAVSGSLNVGGVVGYSPGTITACYWKDVLDNAQYGNGSPSGNNNATPFGDGSGGTGWPTDNPSTSWGIGNNPAEGKYWKELGSFASGVYPKLYWE